MLIGRGLARLMSKLGFPALLQRVAISIAYFLHFSTSGQLHALPLSLYQLGEELSPFIGHYVPMVLESDDVIFNLIYVFIIRGNFCTDALFSPRKRLLCAKAPAGLCVFRVSAILCKPNFSTARAIFSDIRSGRFQ